MTNLCLRVFVSIETCLSFSLSIKRIEEKQGREQDREKHCINDTKDNKLSSYHFVVEE